MAKEQSQELARFQDARLKWHPAIKEQFEIDKPAWRVLCEMIFPAAKSAESILMALSYCKSRNLDIMKRPVHIVPMWSSEKKTMVETVWPGISELRTTAFRTSQFAGLSTTEFGPDVTKMFKGKETFYENKQKRVRDSEVELTYPEWARIDCYRIVNGERVLWAGPTVYWMETYAKASSKSSLPNAMWQQRPRGQLEKCAEAATYRRVFPEEFGSDFTAEEMEGQIWQGSGPIIDHDDAPEPPRRKTETQEIDPYSMGKEAREQDLSMDAPDQLSSAQYQQWVKGWKDADAELTEVDGDTGEIQEKQADKKPVQKDLLGGDDLTEADLAANEVFEDPDHDKIAALWKTCMENPNDYSDFDGVIKRCEAWQRENKR